MSRPKKKSSTGNYISTPYLSKPSPNVVIDPYGNTYFDSTLGFDYNPEEFHYNIPHPSQNDIVGMFKQTQRYKDISSDPALRRPIEEYADYWYQNDGKWKVANGYDPTSNKDFRGGKSFLSYILGVPRAAASLIGAAASYGAPSTYGEAYTSPHGKDSRGFWQRYSDIEDALTTDSEKAHARYNEFGRYDLRRNGQPVEDPGFNEAVNGYSSPAPIQQNTYAPMQLGHHFTPAQTHNLFIGHPGGSYQAPVKFFDPFHNQMTTLGGKLNTAATRGGQQLYTKTVNVPSKMEVSSYDTPGKGYSYPKQMGESYRTTDHRVPAASRYQSLTPGVLKGRLPSGKIDMNQVWGNSWNNWGMNTINQLAAAGSGAAIAMGVDNAMEAIDASRRMPRSMGKMETDRPAVKGTRTFSAGDVTQAMKLYEAQYRNGQKTNKEIIRDNPSFIATSRYNKDGSLSASSISLGRLKKAIQDYNEGKLNKNPLVVEYDSKGKPQYYVLYSREGQRYKGSHAMRLSSSEHAPYLKLSDKMVKQLPPEFRGGERHKVLPEVVVTAKRPRKPVKYKYIMGHEVIPGDSAGTYKGANNDRTLIRVRDRSGVTYTRSNHGSDSTSYRRNR